MFFNNKKLKKTILINKNLYICRTNHQNMKRDFNLLNILAPSGSISNGLTWWFDVAFAVCWGFFY